MNQADSQFKFLVEEILQEPLRETRNSKVKSIFGATLCFSKAPLVGWRKVNHHLGIREMEAFTHNRSATKDMDPSIQKWWEPFEDRWGDQGRGWYGGVYAIEAMIASIRTSPNSRRHLFSAWDYWTQREREEDGYLTNCHSTVCQFYVRGDKLDYQTYQRSADVMLGLPYNLIQHWCLMEFVAHRTRYKPGRMSYILGDAHIYEDHLEAAEKLASLGDCNNKLSLQYAPTSDTFNANDFTITGECSFPIKDKLRMSV